MNTDNGWDALGAQWRAQALPALDMDALQRHARRSGWRLRALGVVDWGSALVAIAVVAHFMLEATRFGLLHALVLVFLALALAYAFWTHRLRRGLYRDVGLAPENLLALQQARCAAGLRFWRMNDRVMVGMMLVLATLALAAGAGLADLSVRAIQLAIMVNMPLVAVGLLASRARRRRLQARLAELQTWQVALRDP